MEEFAQTFAAAVMKATVHILTRRGVNPTTFDETQMDNLVSCMRKAAKQGIDQFLREGKMAYDAGMTQMLREMFAAQVGVTAIQAADLFKQASQMSEVLGRSVTENELVTG
jgi:hypothetical protein